MPLLVSNLFFFFKVPRSTRILLLLSESVKASVFLYIRSLFIVSVLLSSLDLITGHAKSFMNDIGFVVLL